MVLTTALSKWRELSPAQRRTWLRAAFVLTVIGLLLKIMSFAAFKKLYFQISNRFPAKPSSDEQIAEIIWAVESAANRLPMKLLCLPRSLAAKYLLGKSEGVVMHIGVNKTPSESFLFHAWVERHGKIILGDLPTYYQPLWVWD